MYYYYRWFDLDSRRWRGGNFTESSYENAIREHDRLASIGFVGQIDLYGDQARTVLLRSVNWK